MSGSYFAFVASAYAMSVVALGALGAFVFWDARRIRRRLSELEAASGRRREAGR
ncbi:heme exporter protein CcmD [Aureimonas sp. ME7]|uniref:heme exporter protein CcmD n=1 Tax=Aureimonas sp. ME7 TaxID=2744252 RepID=UPI0015F61E45|nr:heme exporter protein CcmD [Aureimonas sp. ME7]